MTRTALQPAPAALTPGVYEDLSFPDYCALPAINHSGLELLRRSPAHQQCDDAGPEISA